MTGEKENVVITAGDCSLTVLPALGGKIASIRVGLRELLQLPLKPYAPRTQTMAFSESDASGWDECLPSVAPCAVRLETGAVQAIPDHGDLWRVPWQVLDLSPDSVTLRAKCFSLPLELTRSLILSQTQTGWLVRLLYSLTNLGAHAIPWSWAAHPLFAVDFGDRIALPHSIASLRVEGSNVENMGGPGGLVSWPVCQTPRGATDLSLAEGPNAGAGHKLFAGPFLSPSEAWATLLRPKAGLSLTVRFEPELTPYLGLWLCYGGWPAEAGPKQHCIALEPATAPVDSLEVSGPWTRSLTPGETFTWPMDLEIGRLPSPELAGSAQA